MPLGAWRLNSLARYIVSAVGGRPITVTANADAQIDTAQSKLGRSSALFDGTGDYLLVDHDTSLDFGTGPFTIECWFYVNTALNNSTFWGAAAAQAAGNYQFCIGTISSVPKLRFLDNAVQYNGSTTVATGEWIHCAAVREGTGTNEFKLYYNGTLDATGTLSTSFTFTDGFRIGLNRGANAYFDGWIDELRISNTARYTTAFTPSTTPFVNDANTLLLLHMDGTDGATDFPDDVGVRQANGVDMQGGAFLDTTDYKFGTGSFNGESTATTTVGKSSYDITHGTGDFTWEAWVYITTDFSTTGTAIIQMGTANNDTSDVRLSVGAGTNNFSFRVGGSGGTTIEGTTIWSLNTWYHVALVRSSGTCTMYVDGTAEGGTATFTTDLAARQIGIGRITYAGVRCMPGNIDEVRISSVARYTSNFTAPTAAFVNDSDTLMLLHFDEASTGSIDFYAYDDNS